MKFCLKTFETCYYCTSLYLNTRFSNYFVQILIIRFKCQWGQKWFRGGKKNSKGRGSCPPCPHTSRVYAPCPHWLNHHLPPCPCDTPKFQKIRSFRKKVGRPNLKNPLLSALDKHPPPDCGRLLWTAPQL